MVEEAPNSKPSHFNPKLKKQRSQVRNAAGSTSALDQQELGKVTCFLSSLGFGDEQKWKLQLHYLGCPLPGC